MDLKRATGLAIRQFRKRAGLSQEAFSIISSRTYLSTLERGLKSPTIEKIDEIAHAMGVHPVSLMFQSYLLHDDKLTAEELLVRIKKEIGHL